MMHTIRVWIYIALLLGAQSCDIVDQRTPSSGEIVVDDQSSLKLGAPSILRNARAVDVNTLTVEVVLTYSDEDGEPVEFIEEVGPSATADDAYWQLGINVPLNTPFVLSLTWFEPAPRLDLLRLTREFGGFNTNGRVEFKYEFSATGEFSGVDGDPNYAGFDSDRDGMSNLEERLADTNPFALPANDGQPLAPVAVPADLNLRALTDGVGTEIIMLNGSGSSSMLFTATSDSPWLTVEPAAGEIPASASFELNVSYSCETLEGDFSGAIELQSDGFTTSVPVQLSCENVVSPLLSAVPSELKLTAQTSNSDSTTLSFRNAGNADLNYSLSSNRDWLTTTDTNGLVEPGVAESIQVSAACGFTQEVRSGEISIESDGGDETVNVVLNCESSGNVLFVQQQSVNLNAQFGAQATSSFVIQNTGTASLNYSVSVEDDWLTSVPASGAIPPESNAVVSVSALCAEGVTSRSNSLTISSDGGDATLSVTQNCKEASLPILSDVSPDLLLTAQSGESAASSISLSNSGEATLTYDVASDSAWLVIGQAVGSIGANDSAMVPVEGQCADFVGSRSAKISIDSNGGTDSVNVSLACEGAELSSVRPASLDLSAELQQSAQKDLSFSNFGNAALNFTIASDSTWITAQVSEGQVQPGQTQLVPISAVCGSVDETRSGSVRIESNGGASSVPVTQTCMTATTAVLANVTSELSLTAQSGQSATSSISLSNTGTAELSYEVFSDSAWLSVGTAAGSINANGSATVSVVAQCTGDNDSFTGMLSVTSNGGSASVPVALSCTTAPTPILSDVTPSLSLTAQSGQGTTSQISLSNSGNAALNYTVSSNRAWLLVGAATGSIAANDSTTVSVEAQCGNFAGNRTGTLSVTSNGGNDSVAVSFNCTTAPQPILSDVTPSLSLTAQSGQNATSRISLSNSGNAALNYSVSSNRPWLLVESPTGSINADDSTTVSVEAQCGEFTGNRTGTLSVTSNGGDDSVSVSFNCTSAPQPVLSDVTPSLSLTAESGEDVNSRISLSNSGNARLNYTVSSNRPWLLVGAATGSINADDSTTVSIEAQCGEFIGNRSGTLSVTSNGGDDSVPVSFNCTSAPRPVLSDVTPSLSLTAQTGEDATSKISLSNSGNAGLNYTVSSNRSWLLVESPTGSIAAGNSTTVSVVAQCNNFTGNRSGTLSVDSNGGDDSVSVSLTCSAAPAAELSNVTPSLSLSAQNGEEVTSQISMSNTGNALLNYTVTSSSNAPWLIVEAPTGSIKPNDSTSVSVVAQCDDFTGDRRGDLNITSNGGDDSVSVVLSCSAPPTAELSGVIPKRLILSAVALENAQADVSFSNTGNANLNYSITSDRNWISTQSSKGVVRPGESQTVGIIAACGIIDETRSGTLTIGGNGGTVSVPVELKCTVTLIAPKLGDVVSSLSLDQTSPKPASSEFNLSNTGDAELMYQITTDSGWLSVDLPTGSIAPGNSTVVEVEAQCTDFIGDRTGKINIKSDGGDHTIVVSLICLGPELGNVKPDFFDLNALSGQTAQGTLSFANVGNTDMNFSVASDSAWLCLDVSGEGACQSGNRFQGSLSPESGASVSVLATCPAAVGSVSLSGMLTISGSGGREVVPVDLSCSLGLQVE